jgi:hypothetical protein
MDHDPTHLTEQPALTTSTGRSWLVVGGLFALVSLGVLIPLAVIQHSLAATVGAITVTVLYLAMVAVRLVVPVGRLRLAILAGDARDGRCRFDHGVHHRRVCGVRLEPAAAAPQRPISMAGRRARDTARHSHR